MKKVPPSSLPCPICKPHRHGPKRPASADPLDPPYVVDEVRPVPDADKGLNIRLVVPWLIVRFEKWFNFNVGDTFKFYAGSTSHAIAAGEVKLEDLDKDRVQLVIPEGLVPRGFIYPCFGQVFRVSSQTPSVSPYETWLIKTDRPGGLSNNPYYHSALILHLPPDLEAGGVLDPERAEQGVDLKIDPYPNMTLYDTIEVWWNGRPVFLEIDQDHIDGTRPIIVHVPESIIVAAGSGLVVIYFRIFDIVLNYSGEVPQWSKPENVEAELNPYDLERAHLVVNGHSVTEVNVDTVGDGPYEAEVYVPRKLPNGTTTPAGALIIITLVVFEAEGAKHTFTLPAFPARLGLSAATDVDGKYIEMAVNGHVQLGYRLTTSTGTLLGNSRRLNVKVSGTKRSMPAMTCVQDEGGYIDPDHPFIRFNFPTYFPHDRNYSVTFRMEALGPGGSLIEYEETLLAGPPPPPERFRIVFKEDYDRFVGNGEVRVFYIVDDGLMRIMGPGIQTKRKSDDLIVTFGLAIADLPPALLQYVDEFDNLDPASVIGGQLKMTLPYTHTFPGDKFIWKWLGESSEGTTGDEITLNTTTAGKPPSFLVDEAFVTPNLHGEIRLSYSLVPKDGSRTRHSEPRTISVGTALVLLRPEVLEAGRHPDELVPEAALDGATIVVTYPQMVPSQRIRACWTGIPGIGSYTQTQDGSATKIVYFDVPPEVIGANLHSLGRYIDVQYFVVQGSHERPSPILSLKLLAALLPKPYLQGHAHDAVLDLGALIGTERAMVDIWHFIHRYQRMWFELIGTDEYDDEYFHALYSGNQVTLNGEQNGIQPQAPVTELRQLKDGSKLTMRFGVTFDRSTDKKNALWFPERNYTVQASAAQYPVPILVQATGAGTSVTLDPLDVEAGATINVTFNNMHTSDSITVEVWGTNGPGSIVLGPKYGELDGTVTFDLPPSVIAANIGNGDTTFTVKYIVIHNGAPRPSQVLTVTLKALPKYELQKTVLRINEAVNGVLDVGALSGDATARVGIFPYIRRGQPVWLRLLGNTRNGAAHNITLLDGSNGAQVTDAWINQGFNQRTVFNTYLRDLGNDSLLTLQFAAALNGSTDETTAIRFPETHYKICSLLLWDETPFTGYFFNGWLSQWPNVTIQRESNGNYFLQSAPYTGSGVRIYKTFTPANVGYYRISFKYRIDKPAAIGGSTYIFIHVGTLTKTVYMLAINQWHTVDVPLGYLPAQPFEASIAIKNPTTGGHYDFDDIKISQTSYPV
ncbi:hypothetical protein ACSSUR_22440 [Pseudomonas cedrina]|uniref:hypothetical protein n=1 Tax=Pseudomonas cedrina TaxID=651740 RepID=UPI003ED86F79